MKIGKREIGRVPRVRPPGPTGVFGTRNILRFVQDPLKLMRSMRDEYGDVVEMRVAGEPWFLLSHPDDIEYVIVKKAKSMKRDAYASVLERTLGLGLLTSEGELWKRQRKLMSQAFTPRRIQTYAETMSRVTAGGVHWHDGREIDLHEEMSRITMEVVAAVLFGAGIDAETIRTVGESMEVINAFYANSPEAVLKLPEWVPTPRNRKMATAVRRIDAVLYEIIAERRRQARAGDDQPDDLLGTLLRAVDDDGATGMTDGQLRDEAITLFLAGHETTALTLAYALMLLGQYPEVERRLAAELDEVLAGRLPDASDVKKLPYTEWVIKEAMRLYPPAWTTGREVVEEVEVRGFRLPKGSQLLLSQWIVHRDPRFFPDPEAFEPERWSPERSKGLPKYAYFPFGGGPRVCIGNHFAMMEAILILAIVVQRYHLELVPDQRLRLAPSVTLRPKRGIRAVVRHRACDAAADKPVRMTA